MDNQEARFVASDRGAVILTDGRLLRPGQVVKGSELPPERLRLLLEEGSLLEIKQ